MKKQGSLLPDFRQKNKGALFIFFMNSVAVQLCMASYSQ